MIDAVARYLCHGGDCVAAIEFMLDAEFQLTEYGALAARAASAAGWMFVFGKPHCPRCSHALQASLLTGTRGAWAEAIKMGIVERAHLQRVEVVR